MNPLKEEFLTLETDSEEVDADSAEKNTLEPEIGVQSAEEEASARWRTQTCSMKKAFSKSAPLSRSPQTNSPSLGPMFTVLFPFTTER